MLKAQRQEAIVKLVNETGSATVTDISNRLNVSAMTIRRDLEELSAVGALVRIHGGARKAEDGSIAMLIRELTNTEKQEVHSSEKAQVANTAAQLVSNGENVFIGTGTTGEALARAVLYKRIRAITNSLTVFNIIKDARNIEPMLIGGDYRPTTGAFVGPMAEKVGEAIGIDKAFVGVNGIYDGAVSTASSAEGSLQRLILDRSSERYIIADSSKVGRRDFYDFYQLGDIDALVTDATLTSEQRTSLEGIVRVLM
ncbi:MAG: DeoR/GlpR transcriptional regulator [Atopobiaceae bacterium]|nr:DeoR/GlpR transcriptional regulator [Olsenella sp.]MBR3327785.1 DeoR/GlpR transcriptional regulator [Atopobiaceae bacterium]MBR3383606.1 DeoR/GlpR transcriptional regulator [Atopobiaceae bacterium]